ncbi:MAG: hypothetical protein AB1531_08310 [Chloroflexota bacterium]
MDIVECLSSSTYPERPIALTWEGERLEITTILSQWRTPEALWFRVQAFRHVQRGDQRTFDLAFFEAEARWQIQPVSGG